MFISKYNYYKNLLKTNNNKFSTIIDNNYFLKDRKTFKPKKNILYFNKIGEKKINPSFNNRFIQRRIKKEDKPSSVIKYAAFNGYVDLADSFFYKKHDIYKHLEIINIYQFYQNYVDQSNLSEAIYKHQNDIVKLYFKDPRLNITKNENYYLKLALRYNNNEIVNILWKHKSVKKFLKSKNLSLHNYLKLKFNASNF